MTWERINLCTQYLNDLKSSHLSTFSDFKSEALFSMTPIDNYLPIDKFDTSLNYWGSGSSLPNINFGVGNVNFLEKQTQLSVPNFEFYNLFKTDLDRQNPFSVTLNNDQTRTYSPSALGSALANKALSYKGKVNNDYEGNKLFSPRNANGTVKTNWSWCCDFVTKNMQDVYGNKLPSGYRVSGCPDLKAWAKHERCYNDLASLSSNEKKSRIMNNLKVGDVVFTPGKGASGLHVGIVTSVNYETGEFQTVSGNSGDKVKTSNKKASDALGFISLGKFAV